MADYIGSKPLPPRNLAAPGSIELMGPSGLAAGVPFRHLRDTDNPHKTTASQVGAYSKSQMDTLLSTLAARLPETGVLRQRNVGATLDNGILTIDATAGNVVRVVLNQNVSNVVFINLPDDPDLSISLRVYVQQDVAGNHGIVGWPETTLWPDGNYEPVLNPAPHSIGLLVFDILASGDVIFATLVHRNYTRI